MTPPDTPTTAPDAWPAAGAGARRVGALVRHNVVLLARDPGHLIAYLVMPMVLMLVEAPLYRSAAHDRGAGTVQVVTGMLVMFSLLSLSIVGNAMLAERTWRTWDRLRATPAPAGELLLGKALPVLGVLVVQQAVLLGFGAGALGLRPAPGRLPLVALAVLVWGAALLGCGSALASVVRSHGQLGAACDIAGLVLAGLGGALSPLPAMPAWARAAAPASPGYWAMRALRDALAGNTAGTLRAAAVLATLAAVTAALAAWRIRRGWSRTTVL
jgi:ABC-2 type transport system permease protein